MTDVNTLMGMLQFMRPAYSHTESMFCKKYLEPVFGEPDEHGNYVKVVGNRPNIAFTAHTDTVHRIQGFQTLQVEGDNVTTTTGSCLGADCTTGLWLMLGMIEAGVDGVYVAHAAEEIGGIGSTALVADRPSWLNEIDAVISFDRFGTGSIITHQGGRRTASDEFASSLAVALDLPLKADTTGTYTDSVEYAELVPECTNISVGYYDQHTKRESQDLHYAQILLERLIEARWESLAIVRDPTYLETLNYDQWGSYSHPSEDEEEEAALASIERLVADRPTAIAQMLHDYGLSLEDLIEEIGEGYSDIDYYRGGINYQYYT